MRLVASPPFLGNRILRPPLDNLIIQPNSTVAFRAVLVAFALASAAAAPIAAQVGADGATCVIDLPQMAPAMCHLQLPSGDSPQTARLLIEVRSSGGPVRNAAVRLYTTSGTVLPDSTRSDAAGNVYALWHRPKSPDTASVVVQAERSDIGSGVAFLRIEPSRPVSPSRIGLARFRVSRAWFERNPLPTGVVLEIYQDSAGTRIPITDETTCASHRVAFGRFANTGTVAPDTVNGAVYSVRRLQDSGSARVDKESVARADSTGCLAVANWTLPEGTGPRNLRASLLPGSNATAASARTVLIETRARALPRIVAGPVLAYYSEYEGVAAGTDTTFHIERTRPDGSTVSFDSIGGAGSKPETVAGAWKPAAFIGVSTPVIPRWTWLSATAGFDFADPTNNWYAGASLLRVMPVTESLPLDIHLLYHWGRSPVLQNPGECASGEGCRTRSERRWHGAAISVTIDAASLITDLIKKLGS